MEDAKIITRPQAIPTDEARQSGRSEMDDLTDAPFICSFGGKSWQIRPLPFRAMQKWREAYLAFVLEQRAQDTDEARLRFAVMRLPDEMRRLVFLYAGDVPAELQEAATEREVVQAYKRIEDYISRPFL